MDVESIFGKEEISTYQARVTVRKGHNIDPTVGSRSKFYLSFRRPFSMLWMFPEAFFHIMDVESILGEKEVWSCQARVMVRTDHKF